MNITLTPSAAAKIATAISPGQFFRFAVMGGGCSGYQYQMGLDTQTYDDDHVFEQHGVKVVVDEVSLEVISGTVIDFVDDLMGSSFKIENPNTASSCGCGNSFSCDSAD